MKRQQLIMGAVALIFTAGGAMIAAPGQGQMPPGTAPGGPASASSTPTRSKIINTGRGEAIPVSVQEVLLPLLQTGPPLRVEVQGKPVVIIDPATRVTVEVMHKPWEYKQVKVPNDSDASAVLNKEGEKGWETTGVMFSAAGGTMLVLKRQVQ